MKIDINEVIKIYFELSNFNNPDFLKYSDDIEQCKILQNIPKNLKKELNKSYNNFMISNGIIDANFKTDDLTDEQLTWLMLLCNDLNYKPEGYQLKLWNFYHLPKFLSCSMTNIYDEFINYFNDLINGYYSQIPYLYFKYRSENKLEFVEDSGIQKITLNKHFDLNEFIKIGKCIQFNVNGFQKNELLYLLYGLCVVYTRKQKFNTFKELLKCILGFVQINILSKCFICDDIDQDDYNLITYIKYGENNYNFRYKPALNYINQDCINQDCKNQNDMKKYIEHQNETKRTKLTLNENGDIYILTKLNKNDIDDIFSEFEKLYKEKQYEKLIMKFFDSQCLTRSTCLTGCLLILILEGKMIEFYENHMPDWFAILTDKISIKETYKIISDIPDIENYPENLNDVLSCLINYTLDKLK